MSNDFDYGMLDLVDHRPWPMPDTPWVMTQTWHDLLFAHWRVDEKTLASRIPPPLELDLHEGEAWVGVVPFHMSNVAPRGVPALPWVSAFPELNVRTYVRVGDKPGVYFFSLDAGSSLAVVTARALFQLPYFTAVMEVTCADDVICYRSRRDADTQFIATYRPDGAPSHAQPGTLEHFLTERYCLYTVDGSGRPRRLDIHHAPWPLQPASARIDANTMAEANGLVLPASAPIVHFSKRQDVVAWLPVAADGSA